MSKLHNQLRGGEGRQPLYEKVYKVKTVTPETKAEAGEHGRDINLTLDLVRFDNEGTERTTILWLNGNFYEKKGTNEGKVNIPLTILRLFKVFDVDSKLTDEEGDAVYDALKAGEFPVIVLPMIEGKELKILEYIAGTYESDGATRPSYRKWNRVYKPTEDGMKDAFLAEFEKTGYPRNYTPEVIKDFNSGKYNVKTEAEAEPAVADSELM